jgi:hypothetical protein
VTIYRSQPVLIDALQYDGDNATALRELLANYDAKAILIGGGSSALYLRRPDRTDQPITLGYWISVGINDGLVVAHSPSAFSRTYAL